ncbi:hypothetical protein PARPLA_00107 [Rhodobacteraceae bacterium THAF1]|uniref:hypothetical protein n=1 Tax=Palleronia sp. THAF1 TaxID=2587842 RepID=UPI000F3DEF6C|nr:hypothetical protein [Palleronia sp. THAF1]QFU07080.1 hypothetical protein FIU81_00095 [Palleronia sp. THAF1]VDC16767.1 hypothetical protein PARPLA_00107 [Rhodobacteraceae bacterium THAF1]
MKHDRITNGWTAIGSDLQDGVWTVRLEGSGDPPKLEASHLHRTIPDTQVAEDDSALQITVKLPRAVLSDGLQSVHLLDKASGTTLASLHIASGKQVSADMTAELALLRDELDLLKRSLRALMAE